MLWVVSIFTYDPWRIRRIRASIGSGQSWAEAIVAAERAAFPASERFVAICTAADGAPAFFERGESGGYSVVQYGRLAEPPGNRPERLRTSEEKYPTREEWTRAVLALGRDLKCEGVVINFPNSDAMGVTLDSEGKVRATGAGQTGAIE
ncbi:MAG: hypothetical protein NDJ94_07305 [Vicinamibacteria bacterium]|nr:hypothetical protein [Vicinamibacteria bacterium]